MALLFNAHHVPPEHTPAPRLVLDIFGFRSFVICRRVSTRAPLVPKEPTPNPMDLRIVLKLQQEHSSMFLVPTLLSCVHRIIMPKVLAMFAAPFVLRASMPQHLGLQRV